MTQTTHVAPGTVVAQRFVLESQVGSGGMGTVFRAQDLQTGRKVALKLLHGSDRQPQEVERFTREAHLLAELQHPGVVSYVAHGLPEDGVPFLAMEWLEGGDLSTRLAQGRLTPRESLVVIQKAAEALAAAHSRGIVHRDLKPSNLYLRDGKLDQITLLDFGIARPALGGRQMTRTGMVIGTLDYMAPEQARGQKDIGPAADIFSLGCVLYECLTGQPPFFGEQIAAVLAKILFEEAKPLRELWPDVPPALETLVMQMLSKDARQRPQDASELLSRLAALETVLKPDMPAPPVIVNLTENRSLADSEVLLVSVIVAVPAQSLAESNVTISAEVFDEEQSRYKTLRRMLSDLGAHSEMLADGTLVVSLTQSGSATDQVAQAARCALAVQERWSHAYVALATGRGVLDAQVPVGEAIDRAVRLIRSRTSSHSERSAGGPIRQTLDGVLLDEVSAGLLDSRFVVADSEKGPILHGTRTTVDESRPLLGQPTPCLGREQELGILEAAMNSCIEELAVRAAIVTAQPGIGKSRLRHEFLRRLQAKGHKIEILIGRGEPMSAGSPYALLSQALRRLSGIHGGEPQAEQQHKIQTVLTRHINATEAQRVAEFLGELCQIPFPGQDSEKLRAARNDPKLMSDQVSQAFLDWLTAECSHQPVLLILEDLHWGDVLTTRLVESALTELHDQPFMVLGLARPEITRIFPSLWNGPRVQEIPLSPLPRRVCERLVRQILGQNIDSAIVGRIVEQSAGNALYLEELVRAQAEGKGDSMPETVLAMLQFRISRLDPGPRRVLRGASLFGTTFWIGGIRALYGSGHSTEDMDSWIRTLISQEVIERHRDSRFPGEVEYGFRQTLMRDAAYSMLTDQDRQLGHRLAAAYLEELGESDAMVIAEHHRLGGDYERAVPYFIRAAGQSYDGHDSAGTLARAALGVECGAKGEALGRLRALQSLSHYFRVEWIEALPRGLEALSLLPPGSFWWCTAISNLFVIAGNIGQPDKMQELVALFGSVQPDPDARRPYIATASTLVAMFSLFGFRGPASMFLGSAQKAAADVIETDARVRGFLNNGHGWFAYLSLADPWLSLRLAEAGVRAFKLAGDLRSVLMPQGLLGLTQLELGDFAASEATLREGLALANRLGEPMGIVNSRLFLANSLADQHGALHLQDARQEACSVIELNVSESYSGCAHSALSKILLKAGNPTEAEEQARKAIGMLGMFRPWQVAAFVNLARALLAQGRGADARASAEEGMQSLSQLGGSGHAEVSLGLTLAEARQAAGDVPGAHAALKETLRHLRLRADQSPNAQERERFLTQVKDNARVIELASAWLGQGL